MRLLITDAALNEISAIGDFVAKDNPTRADSFVQELLNSCAELLNRPERFPIAHRYPGRDVRKRVYGRYLIFFRARAETIEVLHVVNGARDYEHWIAED